MNFASQYEALRERITNILGGEYDGETWVQSLIARDEGLIIVQVATLFDKGNIPKKFVKKNRDLLIFDLHLFPLSIQIKILGNDVNKSEIITLTERELKISLGGFSYLYTANKIESLGFRAHNYYDTVTSNWTIDVDGYSL